MTGLILVPSTRTAKYTSFTSKIYCVVYPYFASPPPRPRPREHRASAPVQQGAVVQVHDERVHDVEQQELRAPATRHEARRGGKGRHPRRGRLSRVRKSPRSERRGDRAQDDVGPGHPAEVVGVTTEADGTMTVSVRNPPALHDVRGR